MVRVGINGFGRIGRVAFRAALRSYSDQVQIVAINTSGSIGARDWAHLLKHDTIYGRFPDDVEGAGDGNLGGEIGAISVGGNRYPVLAEREPHKIPWSQYGVQVVLEATGVFRRGSDCQGHLAAGAEKVIIAAPARDKGTPTYVLGVNADTYRGERVISNASCTTNCIGPIAKVMNDRFQVATAVMTTVHAYTSDQELVDSSHKDLRRGRAAAWNIVPTTTGAAEALGKVLPGFAGSFSGMAIRVPVPCGSLADFSFFLDGEAKTDELRQVLQSAAAGAYRGIILASEEPLVSSDIVGDSASAVVDLSLTEVVGKRLAKVVAWYDNEWGYACRLVEMAGIIGNHRVPGGCPS